MMHVALIGVAGIATLYLAAAGVLFARQRAFIYPAPASAPRVDLPAGFARVRTSTSDGLRLDALYRPAENGAPTIVFFHGNGDSLAGAREATRVLAEADYGLLLPEYRGYAGNDGHPTEVGLYCDGVAALDWLAQRGVPARRIVLIGNSLGSGSRPSSRPACRSPAWSSFPASPAWLTWRPSTYACCPCAC